jgi:ankyrin repeat protein
MGATALHHAAWLDHPELAHILLDGGANPYLRDVVYDATPLGWAHEAGNAGMMELLIERAPPDLVDSAWLGDADRVRGILSQDPGLCDGFDGGRVSPLRSAAWTGHAHVVRVLLEFGADVSIPNPSNGRTALDYATDRGHETIIQMLSET